MEKDLQCMNGYRESKNQPSSETILLRGYLIPNAQPQTHVHLKIYKWSQCVCVCACIAQACACATKIIIMHDHEFEDEGFKRSYQ